MTDTEILDWLEREEAILVPPMGEGGWIVRFPLGGQFEAPTLREAVEKVVRENGDD